jgi:hypothetical protein
METVKHMTLELTAGTWWPLCPHVGPGWESLLLGTGCMLWAGKHRGWAWVRGLVCARPALISCVSSLSYDGTSDLATVESYDPVTNTWQPEVSMGTRRSCLGVAALHGLLYAAGGYDGASCLNR